MVLSDSSISWNPHTSPMGQASHPSHGQCCAALDSWQCAQATCRWSLPWRMPRCHRWQCPHGHTFLGHVLQFLRWVKVPTFEDEEQRGVKLGGRPFCQLLCLWHGSEHIGVDAVDACARRSRVDIGDADAPQIAVCLVIKSLAYPASVLV